MTLKPDQERVKCLIQDTIALLCKNGLEFKAQFTIDAVIGVTLDKDSLFYISMSETIKTNQQADYDSEGSPLVESPAHQVNSSHEERRSKKRKKRDSVKKEEISSAGHGASSNDYDDNWATEQVPSPKRISLKQDNSEQVKEERDVVFIKDEPEESWGDDTNRLHSEQGSRYSQDTVVAGPSRVPSSTKQSLSDMNIVPYEGDGDPTQWDEGFDSSVLHPGQSAMSQAAGNQGNYQAVTGESEQFLEDNPSFVCTICNRKFKHPTSLKRHIQAHYGKHPYPCKYCSKGFTSKENLLGHIAGKHTGEKQFQCDICGAKCNYKSNLKAHKFSVHGTTSC